MLPVSPHAVREMQALVRSPSWVNAQVNAEMLCESTLILNFACTNSLLALLQVKQTETEAYTIVVCCEIA